MSELPAIVDRRLLLMDMKHDLEMFLEAGDEDGYTRGDLTDYFSDVEMLMKRANAQLRGNLLQRVSRWMRADES